MLHKKIKLIFSLIFFLTVIFQPTYLNAEESSINYYSVLKFCTGIVAAFSIHELSHATVAELTNTKINWEANTYNQPIGFTE